MGEQGSGEGGERAFRFLFDHLPIAAAFHRMIYESGRAVDYVFLEVNPAFEEFTGLRSADVLGKRVTQVIPNVNRDFDWIGTYGKVVATGQPISFEQYSEPLARWYVVHAHRSGPEDFVTFFDDVTAQREAEAALRQVSARKDEFLAMLSHELRNPLMPIKSSLFTLEKALPESERAVRARKVIDRQVGHLARLVDDLFDVTRISTGKLRLQSERVDFADVISRTAEDYRPMFADSGVELGLELAAKEGWVRGDPIRLAQVVGNLLQNAQKFTPAGGRVVVRLLEEGGDVILKVEDTGAGMTPELAARIFEPFAQGNQELARAQGGLGLGLALVRGITRLHGGDVVGASAGPGKGAAFTVRLPRDLASAVVPKPFSQRAPPEGRRVLIIEDNRDAAESLQDALLEMGHEVEVASDGPEGLEVARTFHPEVTLCDIGLPGMNGYEVAKAFRADERLKGTRLVALTGYALPEDRQRASESGFDEHVAKPVSLDDLEAALARAT